MANDIDTTKKYIEKQEKTKRRQKLFQILEGILSGKMDSSKTPLARIFNQNLPRQQYVSPKDRSTFNYGYMDSSEMQAGTPFVGD
jgi:hypothetical protein